MMHVMAVHIDQLGGGGRRGAPAINLDMATCCVLCFVVFHDGTFHVHYNVATYRDGEHLSSVGKPGRVSHANVARNHMRPCLSNTIIT